jgi:hypothetical protein
VAALGCVETPFAWFEGESAILAVENENRGEVPSVSRLASGMRAVAMAPSLILGQKQ